MNEAELLSNREELLCLYDLYGSFLSAAQQDVLACVLQYDLSLTEVAQEKGISRAASFDAFKLGVNKLRHYEEVLHLHEKNVAAHKALDLLQQNPSAAPEAAHILQEAFHDGI